MIVTVVVPCHNEQEVIEKIGYDSERDLDNPTSSVFCAHGAGYLVPWYEVWDHMHTKEEPSLLSETLDPGPGEGEESGISGPGPGAGGSRSGIQGGGSTQVEDAEFQAVFEREFGKKQKDLDRYSGYRKKTREEEKDPARGPDASASGRRTERFYRRVQREAAKKDYLLVDGYNVIYAWDELKDLADANLDAARTRLADILANYQGFTDTTVILVFDAYKVKGNKGEVVRYHNIYLVYTKEAETADQYIEKTTHEIGRKHNVTVATSDNVEQVIVMGQGARRISSRDLHEEVERVEAQIRALSGDRIRQRNYLFDQADERLASMLEAIRLGKSIFEI